MDDTISRRTAIDEVKKCRNESDMPDMWKDGMSCALKCLYKLPSAQPDRKRGQWNITDAYPHNVYCSECYTRFAQTHWAVWEDGSLPRNFCPNCGADMREDDHE